MPLPGWERLMSFFDSEKLGKMWFKGCLGPHPASQPAHLTVIFPIFRLLVWPEISLEREGTKASEKDGKCGKTRSNLFYLPNSYMEHGSSPGYNYLFDDVFLLRKNLLDRVCFVLQVAEKTDVGRAFCFT